MTVQSTEAISNRNEAIVALRGEDDCSDAKECSVMKAFDLKLSSSGDNVAATADV